jgi:hypothetical protein
MRRATSPAVELDKKRGNPYLRHGGSLLVQHGRGHPPFEQESHKAGAKGVIAHKSAPADVEKQGQTSELQYHQHQRQQTGREAAAWTDRTREALVGATVGASYVHAGKSYLR